MASDELCWLSATELAVLIRRRKVSPVEVIDEVLDRIGRWLNPQLNAFVTVTADEAERARARPRRALGRRRPTLGPLHGVPFSVKDLVITKGVRTTFGTPLFSDNVPTEDAPMVARLKAAGAIMVGKTNTRSAGSGRPTTCSSARPTQPVEPRPDAGRLERWGVGRGRRGAGPLGVGTDEAARSGSQPRSPASSAQAVLWPDPDLSGQRRLEPLHIGPMTRTVADAALMMQVSAGPDERDPYSLPRDGVDYVRAIRGGVKGLRVAYAEDLGNLTAVDPEVRQAAARAARAFRELGCRVEVVAPRWPSPGECWLTSSAGGWRRGSSRTRTARTTSSRGFTRSSRDRREPSEPVRAGVVRPARLVAAPARVLRALRSAADADPSRARRSHRPRPSGHGRRQVRAAVRMAPVHLPLQPHRTARRVGPLRVHPGRAAHPASRSWAAASTMRRCSARRGRVRARRGPGRTRGPASRTAPRPGGEWPLRTATRAEDASRAPVAVGRAPDRRGRRPLADPGPSTTTRRRSMWLLRRLGILGVAVLPLVLGQRAGASTPKGGRAPSRHPRRAAGARRPLVDDRDRRDA